jgi:MinD-like ATPase involved in chromosome partitioning or flagellar assembly
LKNLLLIECDRRSGVYSIMFDLKNQQGLDNALQLGNAMTPGEWHQHIVRVFGLDLLPADPKHRSPLPSWAEYYQLLQFVEKQYDYLLIDLPEVVNEATAEVVRSARSVFIVCTPEIASLKMARFRAEERMKSFSFRHKLKAVESSSGECSNEAVPKTCRNAFRPGT